MKPLDDTKHTRLPGPTLGFTLALLLLLIPAGPVSSAQMVTGGPSDSPMVATPEPGGLRLENDRETADVTFCSASVVHVVARLRDSHAMAGPRPWLVSGCPVAPVTVRTGPNRAEVINQSLKVSVELATGALRFQDATGATLLQESDNRPRRYVARNVDGMERYETTDRFSPEIQEGLYGLGQHQSGVFNYRGNAVELVQANSDIAVPLLVSTNGYGIFWNSASRVVADNRFARELKLSAEVSDGVDYFFLYGPELDTVIHHYRDLTGHAPMFPRWAYGFIQSKDRYKSAQELLDVAGEYRSNHVPLDMIVQDWFWWKRQGDAEYSEGYLAPASNVPATIRRLHDEHVHTIISVWAVLDPNSDTYQKLKEQNLLIPGTPDYDAFNPKARDLYWDNLVGKLFAQGWDGFWLDSSEPEIWKGEGDGVLAGTHLAVGPGAEYLNAYPLMHTGNIYDHWRAAASNKRAFILTRSAFAGQQRNGTVEWSGDIFGTFPSLNKQIAAGLNFALSGMPYWTTDIAGYFSPFHDEPNNPEYQELYTRWFEFGTFCPILRTHGHRSANELFSYGPQTPTLISYDKLRSRLLPYTYSLAWRVTHEDYTMQRPLVMDWRTDVAVRDIGNEFMFGPSILVAPVTIAGDRARSVYLPHSAAWFDFWSGRRVDGGQRVMADAPLAEIPLYIRAGSILPLGPPVEYASESPEGPTELRIYPGADADFDLYNDEGDSYAYEQGKHATIHLHWDDAHRNLSLSQVSGDFPGRREVQTFRVVVAGTGRAAGPEASTVYKEVEYRGRVVTVHLQD